MSKYKSDQIVNNEISVTKLKHPHFELCAHCAKKADVKVVIKYTSSNGKDICEK